jgi:calmodulin
MARKHAHLSDSELAEFREIFNLVDLDKGGTISKDELRQLMTTLGLKPTQDELNSMVDEIDQDGNGEIDFDGVHASQTWPWPSTAQRLDVHRVPCSAEFVTVMSRKVTTSYTPHQVKAAFKVFERGSPSGFVSMAALEQVSAQLD